jgi:hypothetical protein
MPSAYRAPAGYDNWAFLTELKGLDLGDFDPAREADYHSLRWGEPMPPKVVTLPPRTGNGHRKPTKPATAVPAQTAEEVLREVPKPKVEPLDQWEAELKKLIDPKHEGYEKNSVRRQIRAATLAQETGLRVSPDQVRKRLRALQRDLLGFGGKKGTAGGEVATITEKEFVVSDLIAKGCLTGIAAFNKVGKTKLAVRIAADLIHQQPVMGRFHVAPGPHRIVLWLTDQPGADSAQYLKAVGLMDAAGKLHPQIIRLFTEEDDLQWDDQGADLLVELATEHPGMVLISDSFFANVQRTHGSDNDPEAGGALIDVQTLLAPYGVTHLCLFHSSKEIGNVGIAAIRGHSSAGGAVSACISLHFMERKCPQTGRWVADKENPHRRMVLEGRGAYQDLLIRGDFAAGTFEVIGEYQRAIAEIVADDRKAAALDDLTPEQRQVLEAIGGANDPNGVTVRRIAEIITSSDAPPKATIATIRKQCQSLVKRGVLSEGWHLGSTVYRPRVD